MSVFLMYMNYFAVFCYAKKQDYTLIIRCIYS